MFDRIGQGIYWDRLWRLVDGCTPCSPGCEHCWSARESTRMAFNPNPKIHLPVAQLTTMSRIGWTGEIRLRESNLDLPLRTKKPQSWLILNDLFHKQVPNSFIDQALDVMEVCPQHIFLLLTKRATLIKGKLYGIKLGGGDYIPNVWPGVTIVNQGEADRKIRELVKIPATVRWLSIEPMLGPIDLKLNEYINCLWGSWKLKRLIKWVVLGGESGPGARPMHPDWARSVRDQCQEAGVPFYFKQWGEWVGASQARIFDAATWEGRGTQPFGDYQEVYRIGKKTAGRLLDGKECSELPICK